jgi:hypothetical protein
VGSWVCLVWDVYPTCSIQCKRLWFISCENNDRTVHTTSKVRNKLSSRIFGTITTSFPLRYHENLCLFIAEPSKLEIRHEKMTKRFQVGFACSFFHWISLKNYCIGYAKRYCIAIIISKIWRNENIHVAVSKHGKFWWNPI